jgi:hypothetical protein
MSAAAELNRWSDELLNPMRQVGDPVADSVAAELFRDGDIAPVNDLMRHLIVNEYPIPESLPPVVRDYLSKTDTLPSWADADLMKAGEQVFFRFGPVIIVILHCYSLPFCYLGKNGVPVLALTTRLISNPARRILETAQMMIDVMQPGGLTADQGRGRRSIQKVRLMHAAIRRLAPTAPAWNNAYGMPVNQEDLAGTLMSFSWCVLDGLQRLGNELSDADREAYLHSWLVVGELLGILPEMLPQNVADAQLLVESITRRQFGASAEGQEMTQALTAMMANIIPGDLFRHVPALLVRYFLGAQQAAWLGIQEAAWTQLACAPLRLLGRDVSDVMTDSHAVSALAQKLGKLLMHAIVYVERGGNRPSFSIPIELRQQWGVNWLS